MVAERFEDWLKQYVYAESTLRQYIFVVKKFLKEGRDIRNSEQTNEFLKQHPNPAYRAAIKYFMKFNGVFYDLVKPKAKKAKVRKPVTREELEKLVETIKERDKEVYWVLKTALMTGARIHEVLNLRLRDIQDDYIIFEKTKTGDQRGVWVNPDFIKELKRYLVEEKGILGAEKCFFTNWKTWSAYIEIRNRLEKMFNKDTARILMRTHNFRRAVINYLLKKSNGNILLVQSFIGHKSIDSTERYVYEVRKEELAKKASQLL